jgi:hypothetical protein
LRHIIREARTFDARDRAGSAWDSARKALQHNAEKALEHNARKMLECGNSPDAKNQVGTAWNGARKALQHNTGKLLTHDTRKALGHGAREALEIDGPFTKFTRSCFISAPEKRNPETINGSLIVEQPLTILAIFQNMRVLIKDIEEFLGLLDTT